MLDGSTTIGLAATNIPLLLLSVLALGLTPVPYLGLALVLWTTKLVRLRTDLERRRASRTGVLVPRPYHPAPQRAIPGGWRYFRWTVTDAATWRDLAWLVPGAIVGLGLGTITILLPLYGLAALALPVRRFDAHFARLFLAPTRSADLRLRVTQLTVTRADTVDAQAAELRRIERDLHDGVQARLVSLSMVIGLADKLMDRNPAEAHKLLAEARESSGAALVELRHLVRGIHPPVLAERGLGGAVRALALSLPVPIVVEGDLPGRPDAPVESAAYFAVAEVLTNLIRHSRSRTGSVSLRHADRALTIVVSDDGAGGADPAGGTGLLGIERRLAAFDGTIALSSPPGGPTVITMEVPCALSSPRTMPS
ncbi:histidine kinase [Asanoa ishikariensis]|uniref:histidine kinase n=1 Tax=Asanoa ishikariensis TaxID=137265 RepID=A0A1H3T2E6_9ACTN|nr:histidine kinase [Asanoa ishikariensis]SDZ44354.1 Signal transduction histidine kinase [Asanoa ishikariensis]